jgi:transposase InsO family protein
LFGLSRQAYYKGKKQKEEKLRKEQSVILLVNKVRKRMPKIGGKKIYSLIKEDLSQSGIRLGRDKLFEVLRKNKLLIERKKKYLMTTNSKHFFKKYPNLIKGIKVNRADQVWVSDITYIRTDDGFTYAAMITDMFTRKIVGCSIDKTMTSQLILDALKMALKQRRNYSGLIHHSDRGLQYCSKDYTDQLTLNEIRISMTENSDPYENALAERINRTIKEEFIINEKVRSFSVLKNLFYESIDIYNKERPHLALKMRKPEEIYSQI